MPHDTIRLLPGVDENATPGQNQSGISESNLVRFLYDRRLGALVQKLGGWTKFWGSSTAAIVRALWAWADTNDVSRLAFGTQNGDLTGYAQLATLTNGVYSNITPRYQTDNIPPVVSTTAGDPKVYITDSTITGITYYDVVYIQTHISIGGIILFGQYPCDIVSETQYSIIATDKLGEPLAAYLTDSSPTVATFNTAIGSNTVVVQLDNHGYNVGDTYPILVSTTLGGVTLYGNYLVENVIDANNFAISGQQQATSSAIAQINGGDARFTYYFGQGALPVGSGFGRGGFGRGGFGSGTTITPSLGNPMQANDWTLDNWGEVLVSVPLNGTLYQPVCAWDPLSGSSLSVAIPQAPPISDGAFVAMPQRQIVCWGSSFTGIQDPLLVRWCDVANYSVWIGQVTNQAGSYRLSTGSRIVAGIQGPQQCLLWTDVGIWAMQYIGPPYVYGFNELGRGCGLIGRKAAAVLNGVVYWMGPSQFYELAGEGPVIVDCPVWDIIFQDLDETNLQKIRVAVNSRFMEIAWYYPTISSGGEVTKYVKYNAQLRHWDYGTLSRSAWIDQSVLGPPIGADPDSKYIYQHETSTNADGAPMNSYFQTGYYQIAEGDQLSFVDELWPDMKWGYYDGSQAAQVNVTIFGVDYLGDTPESDGPYTVEQSTQWVNPRLRARFIAFRMGSDDLDSFWRIGAFKYRYQPDGRY